MKSKLHDPWHPHHLRQTNVNNSNTAMKPQVEIMTKLNFKLIRATCNMNE